MESLLAHTHDFCGILRLGFFYKNVLYTFTVIIITSPAFNAPVSWYPLEHRLDVWCGKLKGVATRR